MRLINVLDESSYKPESLEVRNGSQVGPGKFLSAAGQFPLSTAVVVTHLKAQCPDSTQLLSDNFLTQELCYIQRLTAGD